MPDSDTPADKGPAPRPSGSASSAPSNRLETARPAPRPDTSGRWSDLGIRLASALVMLAVTVAALWIGGLVWTLLVAVVTILMGWELARLCEPGIAPTRSYLLAGSLAVPVLFLAAAFLSGADGHTVRQAQYASWGVMLLPPVLGLVLLSGGISGSKWIWIAYGLVIQLGAQFFLFTGLDPWGFEWLLAVVGIVILSDTFGYFAGRFIGGPKFWPRVSPKKTWSGTVAGWIGAAVFAGFWMGQLLDSVPLAVVSGILIAFCGQMGDIAASAIKRRAGVKDASNLIPGHGGFMDRLDAMIAAAAATIVFALVF